MLAKTGLAVISNPSQIGCILRSAKKQVKHMLYVQLMSSKLEPFGTLRLPWPSFSATVKRIYSLAASDCGNLDVRVLLSSLKYTQARIRTQAAIDLVIFDREYAKHDIEHFLHGVENLDKGFSMVTLKPEAPAAAASSQLRFAAVESSRQYTHTVLGGTFDRLHLAHKVLLSEAALHSGRQVTVGVTQENMLESKTLWELIEPIDTRIGNVAHFLKDICPELEYDIVPIDDAMGPTKSDATMDLLIVSAETIKGGDKVNEVRAANGLGALDVLAVELIDEPHPRANEETKISSSTGRLRLLGSLLKPPAGGSLPRVPYIIGLTGGIASGKSGVAQRLQELGACVINCDLLGHQVYAAGTQCHASIVAEFGPGVLAADGEIDRAKLGPIVFASKEKLDALNALVWPAIGRAVAERIRAATQRVVVVEAAVLLAAKWENMCHEVWATVVGRDEAVRRLAERNRLTREQALQRIGAQPPAKFYAGNAHVVFFTLWDVDYTRAQVDKAWELLQLRIRCAYESQQESKY